MLIYLVYFWGWFTANQDISGNANAIIAISTAGLLIFTIILAVIAYRTFKSSVRFSRGQSIENTFFKMIELHISKCNGMYFFFAGDDKRVYGVEAFACLYAQLKGNYKTCKNSNKGYAERELIEKAFQKFYHYNSQIGSYYKNLYYLVKYIDQIEDVKIKEVYKGILKAQLSRFEILLLAYDCIWIEGDKNKDDEFSTLIGKFDLLSALEIDSLLDKSHEAIFKRKKLVE